MTAVEGQAYVTATGCWLIRHGSGWVMDSYIKLEREPLTLGAVEPSKQDHKMTNCSSTDDCADVVCRTRRKEMAITGVFTTSVH